VETLEIRVNPTQKGEKMDVWLIIAIAYGAVAIGVMIFLNIVAPPRGPLSNEMTEDEARNTIIGLFWPVPLAIVIFAILYALIEYAWRRRKLKRKPA